MRLIDNPPDQQTSLAKTSLAKTSLAKKNSGLLVAYSLKKK